MKNQKQLLTNAGAVTGAQYAPAFEGDYMFSAVGTFGGGTVKLQQLMPDGATFTDITDASLSSPGSLIVTLAGDVPVRAVVSGGTPSGIYANLDKV
jgi:hypothetical protein